MIFQILCLFHAVSECVYSYCVHNLMIIQKKNILQIKTYCEMNFESSL